ncbi:MAG: DUF3501 family protein [Candidatus Binatia bacterium]
MKSVTPDDIMGPSAYAKVRDDLLRHIIELKKRRRVQIGDKVSLVFENRDTVIFQIQEMLRAEKITDLGRIKEEVAIYNSSIPAPGELSATLFLEIEEQGHLRQDLLKFLGIDESVYLKVGPHTIHGCFEEGRSKEDKISAVQYVKFPFRQEEIESFIDGKQSIVLQIDHPNYQANVTMAQETRESLTEDFSA